MTGEAPSGVLGVVRAQDWWSYKIPPLLAVASAGLLQFGVPSLLGRVGVALATVLAIAAYGFVLNDLTDITADRASGQRNRMAPLGPLARTLALGLPLCTAFLLAWWGAGPVMRVLIALNLLVPTLYSVPPVRLKGRGVWGALADTIGVHVLPMALVAWTITLDDFATTPRARLFLALAVGWAFLAGFRNIIVHQARGLHGDRLAQVRTFVAAIGGTRARRLVWHWIFPAELVALTALLILALPTAPVLIPVLLIYGALEWRAVRLGWTLPVFEAPGVSTEAYRPIVNNALYEVWLPLGLAVQLALVHPWGIAILAGELLLFRRNIGARIAALRPLFGGATPLGPDDPWRPGRRPRSRDLAGVPVYITVPAWTPDPITHWSADLARGLRRLGVEAVILLTEEETTFVTHDGPRMDRPSDIPVRVLAVPGETSWGDRWAALYDLLCDAAPCVLILTTDWRQSGVVPMLPNEVTVVQVAHGDDGMQREQFTRLAGSCDLVVGGSPQVTASLRGIDATLGSRLVTIPHGVLHAPGVPNLAERVKTARAIIVLASQEPAAEQMVRTLLAALVRLSPPGRLTVLDPDDTTAAIAAAEGATIVRHPNRQAWEAICASHHALVVGTWRPEAERAVVEAMGHGVVPITWGPPPASAPIRDGISGLLVTEPVSPDAVASALARIAGSRDWRALATAAHAAVGRRHYDLDDMTLAFVDRLAWAVGPERSGDGRPVRSGRFTPPPAVVGPDRIFWTEFTVVTDLGSFPDTASAERPQAEVDARRASSVP